MSYNPNFQGYGGGFPQQPFPPGGFPGPFPAHGPPPPGIYPGGFQGNYGGEYGQQPPYGQQYPVPPGGMPPFHFPPPQQPAPKPEDVDFAMGGGEGRTGGFDFTEKSIRLGFIRKVYSILMIQLAVTVGFIALFLYHTPMREWTRQNPGFFIGALVMTFVLLIALSCCESIRRRSPANIIFLMIFTLCEGFVLGAAASTYKADAVLLAAGITTVVCLALTIFSFQTKWDFTAMGGILFVAAIILFVFSILLAILGRQNYPILNLVYACLGALVFSIYLVYDTQLMMGGKHKYSIDPEEYIFAALNLYLDIVQIFMFILQIIGSSQDN